MNRRLFTQLIRGGLAFLLIPSTVACASSLLREEAAAYRVEGDASQQRGDLASALTSYQKAAALDPSSPTLHNDIGRILQHQGRRQEAEQAFQRALAIDSNNAEAHANLALLYEQMGEKAKATAHRLKSNRQGGPQGQGKGQTQELSSVSGVTKPDAQPTPSSSSERRDVVDEELRAHTESIDEFRAVTEQHRKWP